MSIAEFIRESVLRPRLTHAGAMVVYDPDQRYREPCFDLAADKVRVVDASESSIESREAALQALREVGQPKAPLEAVLIYVPTRQPETDEDKQADPFALYAECGAVFPRDDGDDYLSLCLRARPDFATEIRKVFTDTPYGPSFAVIDAIGGGAHWPQLRAVLRVESSRELLSALLAPTALQAEALKQQEGWISEAKAFLHATLSMDLKTRGKTWSGLADELWRFVLFSEFVFDLPTSLPERLMGVQQAPIEARAVIEDVCDRLRNDPRSRMEYIERAEAIEKALNLPDLCGDIEDLGHRDTFPFEERTFLRSAIQGIEAGDADTTRQVLSRHKCSVWRGKGESQSQWELVRAGSALIEACEDFERQLPDHVRSQSDLIDFYLGSLREADRLQREFEEAVGDFLDSHDLMHAVIEQARGRYRRLAEKVQTLFMKYLESAGWPPSGRLPNTAVFDRLIADRLKENGHKVAFLLIDALRYELGVALEKLLSEDGPVELQAAYAQLPTITPVGMASLLPGAQSGLRLCLQNDSLLPKLDDQPVANVSQRMDAFRRKLGDRFAEQGLSEFVRGKPTIANTVDLLVLRSTEIDSQLESNPETALGLVHGTLKLIRVALHKLRGLGFKEAIIATDHGFFLNAHAEAGDVCAKPAGHWRVNAHDRMFLGDGVEDSHNLVIGAGRVGIEGDYAQVAIPKSMAPYRAGHLYFHGGASLAEAVVPLLVARLQPEGNSPNRKINIDLKYRNGAQRVTTRTPVVEIELLTTSPQTMDLFADDESVPSMGVEVLLEAQDKQGNVVGETRRGGDINPVTGTVLLAPGKRLPVAIHMSPDFEGKFRLIALNPTTLASYAVVNLETDYMV